MNELLSALSQWRPPRQHDVGNPLRSARFSDTTAHGARRVSATVENAAKVVAIELLVAAQGCDFHAPMKSSASLERVRVEMRGYLRDESEPPPWDADFAKPIQQTLRAFLEACLGFARS